MSFDSHDGPSYALACALKASVVRLEDLIREGKFDRVFFLSREGLLLYKALQVSQRTRVGKQFHRYILASRRSLSIAACESIEDLFNLLDTPFHPQELTMLFRSRFGVAYSGPNADRLVSRHEKPFIRRILRRLEAELLENASQERLGYLTYLKSKGFRDGGRYLLVDVGYNGTFHRAVGRLFPKADIESCCLAAFSGAKELVLRGKMHLIFGGVRDNLLKRDFFSRNVALIEALFMAPHPSFISVTLDATRSLRFRFDRQSYVDSPRIQRIQREALLILAAMDDEKRDVDHYLQVFSEWVSNPPVNDVDAIGIESLDDRFGGKLARSLIAIDLLPTTNRISFAEAEKFYDRSEWKDGALTLLKQRIVLPPPRKNNRRPATRWWNKLRKTFRSRDAFVRKLKLLRDKLLGRYVPPRTARDDIVRICFAKGETPD